MAKHKLTWYRKYSFYLNDVDRFELARRILSLSGTPTDHDVAIASQMFDLCDDVIFCDRLVAQFGEQAVLSVLKDLIAEDPHTRLGQGDYTRDYYD